MMGLGKANPNCVPNLKLLASAVAEISKGKPLISGSFPSPGPHPFFFYWDLMMGLGKPQLCAKFEVACFIY